MREAGTSYREIGNMIGYSNLSLELLENRVKTTTSIGAVRKNKDRDKLLLRVNAHRDRFSTSRSVAQDWLAAKVNDSLCDQFNVGRGLLACVTC